jgi:hypothetical protein
MLTGLPYRIQIDIPPVTFDVPAGTDILTVPTPPPPLVDPAGAIAQALQAPIGTPPLAQIIATVRPEKAPADRTATVVVSDSTRPDVPYKGTASILHPVLSTLEAQGLLPQHITILVATGTHRASTPAEKLQMFGADVVQRYAIVDQGAPKSRGACRAHLLHDRHQCRRPGKIAPHFRLCVYRRTGVGTDGAACPAAHYGCPASTSRPSTAARGYSGWGPRYSRFAV